MNRNRLAAFLAAGACAVCARAAGAWQAPAAPVATAATSDSAAPPAAAGAPGAAGGDSARSVAAAPGGGVRALGVAKWSALGATVVAAVYGFAASIAADDGYARIERLCAADPGRCEERGGDGGYADPEIAGLEREAASLDRRARRGLIASHVGAAASLVLFILDLRDTGAPPNIPYHPAGLRIGAAPDGGFRLGVRIPGR